VRWMTQNRAGAIAQRAMRSAHCDGTRRAQVRSCAQVTPDFCDVRLGGRASARAQVVPHDPIGRIP
jgi:hypothetical protein